MKNKFFHLAFFWGGSPRRFGNCFHFWTCFFLLVLALKIFVIGAVMAQDLQSSRAIANKPENPQLNERLLYLLAIPENGRAIVVDKDTQTLFLYGAVRDENEKNGNETQYIEKILSFPCATGEVPGPKMEQGDKKTPEGIYFLVDEYEDRYLTPVYGTKAFPTDYPHDIDRKMGKSGSAIWIHGTDKPLQPRSSNGCIALDNKNIMELAEYIHLHKTPVILVDKIQFSSAEKIALQRQKVEQCLTGWLNALESGCYHEYLAYYSSDFLPDMFWWQQWQNFRQWTKQREQDFSLAAEQQGIYSYQNLVIAMMDMKLRTPAGSIFLGTRKLFLQDNNGSMVIVGDTYQVKPDCFAKETFPLVAAANDYIGKQGTSREVMDTVRSWLQAWSSKDMKAYGEFYTSDFTGDGLSRKEWLHRKEILARRYENIQVTGEQFTLGRDKHIVVVRFFQKYRATGFSTDGFKELKLVHIGGSWKIFQEIWKGK